LFPSNRTSVLPVGDATSSSPATQIDAITLTWSKFLMLPPPPPPKVDCNSMESISSSFVGLFNLNFLSPSSINATSKSVRGLLNLSFMVRIEFKSLASETIQRNARGRRFADLVFFEVWTVAPWTINLADPISLVILCHSFLPNKLHHEPLRVADTDRLNEGEGQTLQIWCATQ
jgi:hypothetical protein